MRPVRQLFTEPIVLLGAMYMAFIFSLLYLRLTAFVLVFQVVYVVNSGIGGPAWFVTVFSEFLFISDCCHAKKNLIFANLKRITFRFQSGTCYFSSSTMSSPLQASFGSVGPVILAITHGLCAPRYSSVEFRHLCCLHRSDQLLGGLASGP